MAKIYKNQSRIRIILDSTVDISTATTRTIKYMRPDKTTGSVTGTLTGTTSVYYDITKSTPPANEFLYLSGEWRFWVFITFSDARIGIGEPAIVQVYDESQ